MTDFIKMTIDDNIAKYEKLIEDQVNQIKMNAQYDRYEFHNNHCKYIPHFDKLDSIANKKIAKYEQFINRQIEILSKYYKDKFRKDAIDRFTPYYQESVADAITITGQNLTKHLRDRLFENNKEYRNEELERSSI